MDFETKLNDQQIECLIRYLSKRFNVRRPKLLVNFNPRAHQGRYYFRKEMILIGFRSAVWVAAHEFTHHLHYMRDRREFDRIPHGRSFYDLLRIVARSIGDERDYPWAREYRQIYRWAKADGVAVPQEWERLQAERLARS